MKELPFINAGEEKMILQVNCWSVFPEGLISWV
jgi:hypothetical protein